MGEGISARRRRGKAPESERELLQRELQETRLRLSQAYADFNFHSDPDLVDACVYTINALRSRYSYLVRQAKRLEREAAG